MTLVFVDLESTGLDPRRHLLLEVGLVATTGGLDEIDRISVVIHQEPGDVEDCLALDPAGFVRGMHTRSGLLGEVASSRLDLLGAEDHLLGWAEKLRAGRLIGDAPGWAGPMCGSSVHFDRAWLAEHMPRLHRVWGHRNLDVSSTREQAKLWAPRVLDGEPGKREAHRALPDLEDTIGAARHLRRQLFGVALPTTPVVHP